MARRDEDGDRGFLRGFLEDYKGLLGILLLIVIFTVVTDPQSVGKWFHDLASGFSGTK